MSIEVKDITKLYGEQKALNSISFSVNSAEIVGFLGPNGAGKSTMMKILTTYINPSEGEAKVNGYDGEWISVNNFVQLFRFDSELQIPKDICRLAYTSSK